MAEKQNQKITIPLSENDLQELIAGEDFHWTFTTDKGEDIDIYIKPEEEEDLFEDEELNEMNTRPIVD